MDFVGEARRSRPPSLGRYARGVAPILALGGLRHRASWFT